MSHGFLWEKGQMRDLGGGAFSIALAINDRGDIAGQAITKVGERRFHAVLWRNGLLVDLQPHGGSDFNGIAVGINTRGQVIGVTSDKRKLCQEICEMHGVIWSPTPD